MKYKTILADPPWEMGEFGTGKDTRPGRVYKIGRSIPAPYPTMTIDEICKMDVLQFADDNCHLWLWTTNRTLHDAFHVMDAWGFKYLNTVTFKKPAGAGAWFVNVTQHLLFGYRGKLEMGEGRYSPTFMEYTPRKHSGKPENSYQLIESISFQPMLELFARPVLPMFPKRNKWHVWGNEVDSDVQFAPL